MHLNNSSISKPPPHIISHIVFNVSGFILKNDKVGVPLQKLFCSFWDSVVKRKQKRVKKPKDISIKIRAEKKIRKINT